ncbi:DUF1800 family protein [Aestuariibacter salexigens]|uniref:DUF1800 family protein n=1 Tax=Aestuariibacter salexigens TaxID=226010 RepID=UPI0004220A25|nr:DUF1800 family protein [Aestuariibacter salexigens]
MHRLLAASLLTLLAACGGGGGGETAPPQPPTPPDSGDRTAPPPPTFTVGENQGGTLTITGSAEAGSRVDLTYPDGQQQTITASQTGDFGPSTSELPQPNGDIVITATDEAGNRSDAAISTYTDAMPPGSATYTIDVNSNGTLSVEGTAEALSSVSVTFPDSATVSTTANTDGQYGPVTSAVPQTSGTLTLNVEDLNGNAASAQSEVYNDITAPLTPTLNVIVNEDNTVSVDGIAEGLSLVQVVFQDGTTGSTQAQANGLFRAVTSSSPQASGRVIASATDAAGNVSEQASATYEVEPENDLWELADDEQAQDIVRFLTQSTFGPTEHSIHYLMATDADYASWIDGQINTEQTILIDKFEKRLREAGLPITSRANLDHAYHKQLIANDMLMDTFAYGEDQLRQRVAFALSQIFVVSETSDTLFNNAKGVVAYHDLLARHALGNYRDLLEAVTLNPIMGEYLSMIRNEKANSEENIRPDENYAREMMQLFSIGLVMLDQDGTVQLDEQGQPVPTYDQEIIKAFARVLTGWTYNNAGYWDYDGWLFGDMQSPMIPFEAYHDSDEKTLLNGEVLPAGQSAYENLTGALDNVFNHPNVPPFISKQLIQRLVTSNPSPEYVARISAVFRDNGDGVRGDLGAVVKAILLDEEARSGHLDAPTTFGKLKEPMLKFTALIRAFDVTAMHPVNDSGALRPTLRWFWPGIASGQRPYGSPSVFNFYRPDHSPAGPIRDAGLVAPEMQILNESYITAATNFGSATIFNSYDFILSDCEDRRQYLDGFGCPYPDFSDEIALAGNVERLLDRLNLLMMAGQMSDVTRDALTTLASQQSQGRYVVAEVVHLLYHSPGFAVQK